MSSYGVPAATRMLTLWSYDWRLFVVESDAFQCHTIKKLFEYNPAERSNVFLVPRPIHIPNVTSTILAKVIEYCRIHVYYAASMDGLRQWDAEFVRVNQAILFDLVMAAKYLDIKSLLDLTWQPVADMIKDKHHERQHPRGGGACAQRQPRDFSVFLNNQCLSG